MNDAELTPGSSALRSRTYRRRKKLQKLSEAGVEVPLHFLATVACKRAGRRPLSKADIRLPVHAAALRQRIWRAHAAAQRALADAEAAGAIARLACAHEAEVEAESLAAEQQLKLRKLERQLDARNISDGVVADGPRAIRLRAFARDHQCVCAIGSLCEDADESGAASNVRRMRCCGEGMCARCLSEWLRRKDQWVEMGYEDDVQGVQHVRRGRKLWVRMNTHTCPMCRAVIESARRALV